MVHLRIDAYWEKAIQGLIILAAVMVEGVRQRRNHGR
jgi:ribose/xylose/arabinose/galactoside ABC-type transport system permease subunit